MALPSGETRLTMLIDGTRRAPDWRVTRSRPRLRPLAVARRRQAGDGTAYPKTAAARLAVPKRQSMLPSRSDGASRRLGEGLSCMADMSSENAAPEERRRGAVVLAKLLYRGVASRFPGKWRVEADEPDAIDEGRSGPIIEFRLAHWPPRFRLSIHSDSGASRVGYGVFRPPNMNRRSNDEGLREHLAAKLPFGDATPVHWAWYRKMDEPLQDLSRPETLIEVEQIRRREPSKGDDAFRRASNHLATLAAALDEWYSAGAKQPRDACAPPPGAAAPL